jgi:hypothetical protein
MPTRFVMSVYERFSLKLAFDLYMRVHNVFEGVEDTAAWRAYTDRMSQ